MEKRLTLEERVDKIEIELASIKSNLSANSQKAWWQRIVGVFENDPEFDEISALGQSIRERERLNMQS